MIKGESSNKKSQTNVKGGGGNCSPLNPPLDLPLLSLFSLCEDKISQL